MHSPGARSPKRVDSIASRNSLSLHRIPSIDKRGDQDQSVLSFEEEEKPYTLINELSTGGYFGEIALMTKLKRTCSVFAINSVVVGVVSKDDFLQLTENSTDFKHRVLTKI